MALTRSTSLLATVFALTLPATALAQPSFVEIAREFGGGLMWLDADVPPALAEDGSVAFAGSHDFEQYAATRIFVGDGGALLALDMQGAGLDSPYSVDLNDAGQVALSASRADGGDTYRGAYITTTASGSFSTVYEGLISYDPELPPPVGYNVPLSPNGTLAYSSIRSSAGGLYRGAFGTPLTLLREGSGIFYNTMRLDVNDAGQVAVQMEYTDPTAGLSRGILIFDAEGQTLAEIDTAIERQSVGTQPQPAINASGQVAFALNSTVTMRFFDPPGVFGTVLEEVTLTPGVYLVTPAPWGTPKHPTLIAGTADGYTSFGTVDLNDMGEIAFEAAANGEYGVFVGPDPIADKVLATGDVRGDQLFSVVRLGELNNGGSISLLTSDFNSTDRQIWRVDGVFEDPEPPPGSPLLTALRELILRILRLLFRL